jgi:hypothetical protein
MADEMSKMKSSNLFRSNNLKGREISVEKNTKQKSPRLNLIKLLGAYLDALLRQVDGVRRLKVL